MFETVFNFIREIYRTDQPIALHEPRFLGNEKKYVNDCIDSTFVSSVGKYVTLFEEKMAAYTGSKYAVATGTGTAALHIALIVSGVQTNDEVISQPISFIATANAIRYCQADPVFLDINPKTLGLSADALQSFLEESGDIHSDGFCYNRKTKRRIKACVPMHTFGHPVEIERISALCQKYHLTLIEDAAESIGSFYNNRHTGTFGEIGILSFNGNKTITTGGGGMILTHSEAIAGQARHLTTQAKIPHPYEYNHDAVGYNYRMPNLNAALGLAQLEQIDFFIRQKRQLAEMYEQFFNNRECTFFREPEFSRSNYWLNSLLLTDKMQRNHFLAESNRAGIMCRPVWNLLNQLPMYTTCQTDNLENALDLAGRLVNIPSSVPDKKL